MEILIPGLILVALMVYASTRIKRNAAAAFDEERIETDRYSINKPKGFLHVLGRAEREFKAYSKEFGEGDNGHMRRATIEIDVVDGDLEDLVGTVKTVALEAEVTDTSPDTRQIVTNERTNETDIRAVYKFVRSTADVYRLRFSALSEHFDDYADEMDETLHSFNVKT